MTKHYRPPGKKKEGNAAKYITRSQAVKHLQVSLPIFRKLCILKGIFPREPKKKVKGNHQTYYHTKDMAFIQNDPIVEVLREQRAHAKKVKKALSKKNKERAQRLLACWPMYNVNGLVKQRYPRFADALRDLEFCLALVHLFAALPTLQNEKLSVSRIHCCRRLIHEWQAYIARTHKLRRIFLSVKGIYFQVEVEGQKITYITPHAVQQVLTDDIDFNVLLTYMELCEKHLASVNLGLYNSINVKYPPILDPRLEAVAGDLYALSTLICRKSEAASSTLPLDNQRGEQIDGSQLTLAKLQPQLATNDPRTLMQLVEETEVDDDEDEETKTCRSLFRNMRFFLSREVPRELLLFVISAFGGTVSWEGSGALFDETDPNITHQIVDRPTQGHMFLSRDYIQPQWVFDCVNARVILPTEEYLVGRVPPPHLSPFVDNDEVGYIPDYAEKIKQLQAAASKYFLPVRAVGKDDLVDTEDTLSEGIASHMEIKAAAVRKPKLWSPEKQYHEELKMEVLGVANASGGMQRGLDDNVEALDQPSADQIDEGEDHMDKVMMSRRNRGLFTAIQKCNKRKQADVDLLKSRKRLIESKK